MYPEKRYNKKISGDVFFFQNLATKVTTQFTKFGHTSDVKAFGHISNVEATQFGHARNIKASVK